MPAAMFMDSNTEGQLHAMCHIVGARPRIRPRVRGSTGGRRASRANPKMPARAGHANVHYQRHFLCTTQNSIEERTM